MAVTTVPGAPPASGKGGGGTSLGSVLSSIRRYWWVVMALTWLAVAGALIATALTPTTYVGRTSLIVSSNDRSPEQDAVLVQGYVTYFNNDPYQQQLLADVKTKTEVTVSAQAAAASPIVVISATALDAETAQSAAIAVGRAFKDDINRTHDQRTAATLATLQDQLDTALARKGQVDQAVIAGLQDRIRQVQADRDNVLQDLQLQGGVLVQPPPLLTNVALGLLGGLVAGSLAAFALGRVSSRLFNRYDVADKVGVSTLAELPPVRSRGTLNRRKRGVRRLANLLRARLGGPGSVAIAEPADSGAAAMVARLLAIEWANQGHPTVLVRLGDRVSSTPARAMLAHPNAKRVDASAVLADVRTGPVAGMSILDLTVTGSKGHAQALSAAQLKALLQSDLAGAYVVVEAAPVVVSAVGQDASLAADTTILVLDTQVAEVTESREAVRMLRELGVDLLGAVLAPLRRDRRPAGARQQAGRKGAGNEALWADLVSAADGNPEGSWWSTTEAADGLERPSRPAVDGADKPAEPARNGAARSGAGLGKR